MLFPQPVLIGLRNLAFLLLSEAIGFGEANLGNGPLTHFAHLGFHP